MMRGWSYRKTLNGTPTLARSPTVGLKASKRLHILRVLRNPSVITIYISLIRSILEYCCAVWSISISLYLSDKLKKFRVVPYVFSIRICPTLLSLTYLLSLACLIAATLSAWMSWTKSLYHPRAFSIFYLRSVPFLMPERCATPAIMTFSDVGLTSSRTVSSQHCAHRTINIHCLTQNL